MQDHTDQESQLTNKLIEDNTTVLKGIEVSNDNQQTTREQSQYFKNKNDNRKSNLVILLIIQVLSSAGGSLFDPFYPDLAKLRGLDEIDVGYIFAVYCLGSLIVGILTGKMMKFWGRKKILFVGLLLQASVNILQGCLILIKNQSIFFWISILSRLVQGVGCGCFTSIAYAYIPILFPDSVAQKISYMEVCSGVGLILGPFCGTLLYMLGGYMSPFIFCSVIFAISIPISMFLLPSDDSINEPTQKQEQPLSILKFIGNVEMSLTILLVTISFMSVGFMVPFLPYHLHGYGVKGELVGFFFIVPCMSYMIAAIIFDRLPKYVDLRVWIITGTIVNIIGLEILGPEQYTYLPRNLITSSIGLLILGIGIGIFLIPTIPQLIIIGKKIFPDEEQKVSDMSSGFFNFCTQLSGLFSPNLGGILVKYEGFNRACSILSLITLVSCVIYGIVCNGFVAFRTLVKEKESSEQDYSIRIQQQ